MSNELSSVKPDIKGTAKVFNNATFLLSVYSCFGQYSYFFHKNVI